MFGTDRSGDGEKVDVDNTLWGQIQSEDEEESEEEDEDEEEENEDEDDDDMESGLESMTSMSSSGMDTPEVCVHRQKCKAQAFFYTLQLKACVSVTIWLFVGFN